MKYVLAFIALLFAIPVAEAAPQDPDWTFISTTTSGTRITALTSDLQAGRSDQTAAKVWVDMDASSDSTVRWRSMRILYAVNCTNQTYRRVTMTAYLPNGTSDTVTEPYPDLKYIVPDTNMHTLAAILCYDPGTNTYR